MANVLVKAAATAGAAAVILFGMSTSPASADAVSNPTGEIAYLQCTVNNLLVGYTYGILPGHGYICIAP